MTITNTLHILILRQERVTASCQQHHSHQEWDDSLDRHSCLREQKWYREVDLKMSNRRRRVDCDRVIASCTVTVEKSAVEPPEWLATTQVIKSARDNDKTHMS